MAAKVVDASAIAAVLFGEPEADRVLGDIEGVRLAAPALLAFELASVCRKKCRRHPDQRAKLIQAFGWRERLNVERMAVDHEATLALAEATGLTTYDASYLWLARHLGVTLVTLDAQLAKAAAAC